MKLLKFYPVGKTFKYDDVELEVVQAANNMSCASCYFFNENICFFSSNPNPKFKTFCFNSKRKDKTSINYKKL